MSWDVLREESKVAQTFIKTEKDDNSTFHIIEKADPVLKTIKNTKFIQVFWFKHFKVEDVKKANQ